MLVLLILILITISLLTPTRLSIDGTYTQPAYIILSCVRAVVRTYVRGLVLRRCCIEDRGPIFTNNTYSFICTDTSRSAATFTGRVFQTMFSVLVCPSRLNCCKPTFDYCLVYPDLRVSISSFSVRNGKKVLSSLVDPGSIQGSHTGQ